MTVRPCRILLALPLMVGVLGNGPAPGKVIDDGPQSLSQVSSIGETLRNAGHRSVHILYVHGIGATSSGGSQIFQKAICGFLKDCTTPAGAAERDYADRGEFENGADPPAFEYMGTPVWKSKEEWSASAPFVDHYVLRRSNGRRIVVDEINWWPLVRALKCRAIMAGDTRLVGPNAPLLDLCSQPEETDFSNPGRFRAFTWIAPADADKLKAIRPRGALINRSIKTSLLDWGFSDAMMAVGPLRDLFRTGMRQLFLKSVRFRANGSRTNEWEQQLQSPRGIDREFIVVSHSLGSYLVFSTLNLDRQDALPPNAPTLATTGATSEDAAAQYILERTSLVYFFANQVPLLELANLKGPKAAGPAPAQAVSPDAVTGELAALMMRWRTLRDSFTRRRGPEDSSPPKPPQVVAWSDPSDLLSWRLPAMDGLVITNLYVRNTGWHWIIANPAAAHANYAINKEVLRVMFGPKVSTRGE